MNQDEFETLVASLAAQYADACDEEIAALQTEAELEREVLQGETRILYDAYACGTISGKNAELRKLQCGQVLLDAEEHQRVATMHNLAVTGRKRATAIRVGVEHEWKTWRAWLASTPQGGNGV